MAGVLGFSSGWLQESRWYLPKSSESFWWSKTSCVMAFILASNFIFLGAQELILSTIFILLVVFFTWVSTAQVALYFVIIRWLCFVLMRTINFFFFNIAEEAALKGPETPLKNRILFQIAHKLGDDNKVISKYKHELSILRFSLRPNII